MTQARQAVESTIVGMWHARAAETPDDVAVVAPERSLTYAQLDREVTGLARRLRELGAGPEDVVALYLPRSTRLLVSILATLTAGSAYLPIDPRQPLRRTRAVLHQCQPRVAISDRPLPLSGVPRLSPAELAEPSRTAPHVDWRPEPIDPENLAYVILTSGSTGSPKGVMVPHAAVTNRLRWGQSEYPLRAADRVLQLTPAAFDFSVWEIFAPLVFGATLVLPGARAEEDVTEIAAVIRDEAITVAHFVPSVLRILLQETDPGDLESLRLVFCGGEVLHRDLAADLRGQLVAVMYNQYGPTETCIDSTFFPCDEPKRRRTVPIGRAIANTSLRVLDGDGRPVQRGLVGELYIGGSGVARGYFGRSDLTAERFVPDDAAEAPGRRLYRTGDLVRWLTTDDLEFVGRVDDQVKVRGVRVEPGEAASLLTRCPGIAEAFVCRTTVPRRGDALAAFVVPDSTDNRPDDLSSWLRQRLPEAMVPAYVVEMDALPRLPNGKIDRDALRSLDLGSANRKGDGAPASTPVEEILLAWWCELFGESGIGIDDDFFDLGGHSLLATQIVARVRRELDAPVKLRELFEGPTVRQFAAIVEGHLAEVAG